MLDEAIEVVRLLGGSEVDVVTALLPTQQVPNIGGVADYTKKIFYNDRIDTDIRISALKRCDAKFRAVSLE